MTDMEHLVTYIRLLDANTDGVAWTDAARTVLLSTPTGSAIEPVGHGKRAMDDGGRVPAPPAQG
jgi:hypothetical protein